MKYYIIRHFNVTGSDSRRLWDYLTYYDPIYKSVACGYDGGNFASSKFRTDIEPAKRFYSLRTVKVAAKRLSAYWGMRHQVCPMYGMHYPSRFDSQIKRSIAARSLAA